MAKKYHSMIVENKLKEKRTEMCADNNRHKKKKKKSKTNQQQFLKTDKVGDKNLQAGCKDKKEMKTLELKNEVIYDNFQKADIALRKNKKLHNQIDVKQSGSTYQRKPSYVNKKRDIDRSKNYDFLCYSNRFNHLSKDHNSVDLCSNIDLKKNDQNNRQLNNQKSNDRAQKSVRAMTPSKYADKDQRSNSIFITTQNNTDQLYDRNMKCHAIKTMIINRGTKYTKTGLYGQYTAANNFIENHKITNNTNLHDKHNNWGFYSHNGQNTYSIENKTLNKNRAETPNRNKHIIKNTKAIVESFHKSKYEKSVFYVGSEYINQEIEKNQKLTSDVMDINFGPLSDSTFISTINWQTIQDNNKQNKEVSTSQSKMAQTCNVQNYSNTINNNSPDFFYDQNQLEEDKYNPRNYYLKCMETINSYYSEENVNFTNKNNLNKKKIKVKYYDEDSNGNNYNDIKSIQINNLDNFTAYFDKVWEAVMQEISGY